MELHDWEDDRDTPVTWEQWRQIRKDRKIPRILRETITEENFEEFSSLVLEAYVWASDPEQKGEYPFFMEIPGARPTPLYPLFDAAEDQCGCAVKYSSGWLRLEGEEFLRAQKTALVMDRIQTEHALALDLLRELEVPAIP